MSESLGGRQAWCRTLVFLLFPLTSLVPILGVDLQKRVSLGIDCERNLAVGHGKKQLRHIAERVRINQPDLVLWAGIHSRLWAQAPLWAHLGQGHEDPGAKGWKAYKARSWAEAQGLEQLLAKAAKEDATMSWTAMRRCACDEYTPP